MARTTRPSLDCGIPTRNAGGRCDEHTRTAERARHNRAYDRGDYRRARAAAIARWVAANGWVCPGDDAHPPHATRRLSADHPLPLSRGGAVVQDFRIICVGGNARRGARALV